MTKEEKREYDKEYSRKNKKKKQKNNKEYYQKNKKKILEYQKDYYQKNKEKKKEQSKKWREKNPNYNKEYNKEWTKENRDLLNFYYLRRRARKKGAEGSHTLEEWEDLKELYNYICPSCEKKEPEIQLTEDHIEPLSLGGIDYIDNIQPLCHSCNSSKRDKIIFFEPIINLKKVELID